MSKYDSAQNIKVRCIEADCCVQDCIYYIYIYIITRTVQTYRQTTFLQVPRVRRGATQRDYRLLYYKFSRFPENPELRLLGGGGVDAAGSRRKSRAGAFIPQNFIRAARGMD